VNEQPKSALDPQNRRTEYQEIGNILRFLATMRHAFLALAGTHFTVLAGAYGYVWVPRAELQEVRPILMVVIPFVGIVVSIAALLLERRIFLLYGAVLARSTVLEQTDGLYHILAAPRVRVRMFGILVTHATVLATLYVIMYAIWFSLACYGVFGAFSQ